MTHASSPALARADAAAREIDEFRRWIRGTGGSDLIETCHAIGGDVWRTRARLARHSVLEGHGPYVVRARLQASLKILRLGQAGRLPGIGGTNFAPIGERDPRAKTAQACVERLERVLTALETVSLAGVAATRRAAR